MYNRYIRNDLGTYTRISQEEAGRSDPRESRQEPPAGEETKSDGHSPFTTRNESNGSDGLSGILRHFLDRFHLDHIDPGDLLLLIVLFFLFREDADEELLIALGLLIIL